MSHLVLPDSSLERSRIWLIRRMSRSLSLMMIPRNSARSSSSTSGLSRRISENARIEVRGVRNSCEMLETKSSLSLSTSLSRSLAAFARPWRLRARAILLELVAIDDDLGRLIEHAEPSSTLGLPPDR